MTTPRKDGYEVKALELIGHEDCPHWKDDNFYCLKCYKAEPISRALRLAAAEAFEEAAGVAGGHTGPGNTLGTSEGYSNACREIRATLCARASALRQKEEHGT